MIRIVLMMFLVLILEGCGYSAGARAPRSTLDETSTPQSSEGKVTQAQVSLQIYSGRQAPTWSLSEADTKALTAIIATLPPGDRQVPDGKLGEYSGFIVSLSVPASGNSRELRVYNGAVASNTGDTTELFADPSRSIEKLLLASAKPHLSDDLYALVVTQAKLPE